MDNSILLARNEFVKRLTDLINESNIPAFVMEYILRDVLTDVNRVVQDEFRKLALAQESTDD